MPHHNRCKRTYRDRLAKHKITQHCSEHWIRRNDNKTVRDIAQLNREQECDIRRTDDDCRSQRVQIE